MSETKGIPPQLFDKHFIAYVKTLELRAELEIGKGADSRQLIDKMIEIEARDKEEERKP